MPELFRAQFKGMLQISEWFQSRLFEGPHIPVYTCLCFKTIKTLLTNRLRPKQLAGATEAGLLSGGFHPTDIPPRTKYLWLLLNML